MKYRTIGLLAVSGIVENPNHRIYFSKYSVLAGMSPKTYIGIRPELPQSGCTTITTHVQAAWCPPQALCGDA